MYVYLKNDLLKLQVAKENGWEEDDQYNFENISNNDSRLDISKYSSMPMLGLQKYFENNECTIRLHIKKVKGESKGLDIGSIYDTMKKKSQKSERIKCNMIKLRNDVDAVSIKGEEDGKISLIIISRFDDFLYQFFIMYFDDDKIEKEIESFISKIRIGISVNN